MIRIRCIKFYKCAEAKEYRTLSQLVHYCMTSLFAAVWIRSILLRFVEDAKPWFLCTLSRLLINTFQVAAFELWIGYEDEKIKSRVNSNYRSNIKVSKNSIKIIGSLIKIKLGEKIKVMQTLIHTKLLNKKKILS